MNRIIMGLMMWMSLLMSSVTVHAASFDCAKARAEIEHLICDNPKVSSLDSYLHDTYQYILSHTNEKTKQEIISSQRDWLKHTRNDCGSAGCLESVYGSRLFKLQMYATKLGHYVLRMNKNDEMCNHMLNLINEDQKKRGRIYGNHDHFAKGLNEFKSIAWKPARFAVKRDEQTRYVNVEGALFDINNDGVSDFVVRDKGMLSGRVLNSLYILDAKASKRANDLQNYELFESKNKISLAGGAYKLSSPMKGASLLWRLSPFIYHGVSYIYMQSLYSITGAIGGDLVVISKYYDGTFSMRKSTGRMEDICYIKRMGLE